MSDKNKEIQEDREINIDDPDDIREWCEFFGIEEGSLTAAVKFVGASSQKVKKFLGK